MTEDKKPEGAEEKKPAHDTGKKQIGGFPVEELSQVARDRHNLRFTTGPKGSPFTPTDKPKGGREK